MAADRARADEEDLKVSPFQKGEWEQTRPTELDVDYALLAEALGPAGAPAAEIHVVRSLARGTPQKTQTSKLPDPAAVARTPFWSFCAG